MEAKPLKLMLGEPRKGERGYTTIDIGHEADVHFDLNNPLTDIYPENSVDLIGAYHLIEHLKPTQIRKIIKSWVDALKSGGIMNIECPDFDGCIEWYRKDKSLLSKQWIFGDDSREGQHHFWGFNVEELDDIVKDLPVRYAFADPQDYHKEQGPCLRIEIIKV